MSLRSKNLRRFIAKAFILVSVCYTGLSLPVFGQTRNLTAVVLVNSQNASGYNLSPSTPGEFQRFTERYLGHLQVPYELFDVSTASPPADLDSRQLIISGHSRLQLPAAWRNGIAAAVSNGTGFVNLDSDISIGSESHIATIFGATGSTAGTPATQIVIPVAVAPGGATPHYITALQKKFDDTSGTLVYPFHVDAGGVLRSATSTVLANAQGTVIARLGNDPLILASTHGAGRAVHFGTLDYLRADRFGFVMGLDDLFWRSLVWAARKPFVLRGYPRLWSVQMDDTRLGFGTRVRDMYDPAFTGTASSDGVGGPWKITGYLFTDLLAPGSVDRGLVIADINAGKLEVSPHSFADVGGGNMYWNNVTASQLTDQQWQTNMNAIDAWKQGNGGADTIPSFSRSMVPHYWNLSDNTGSDLWNRYGFRYITTIQRPGFVAGVPHGGNERIPARPFWNYELPPITFKGSFAAEDYHFFFADDFSVRSRAGLPMQTFFLFATQYLDYTRYERVDFLWPKASPTQLSVNDSIALLKQYTWRFWSGLAPVQVFTHDAINYQNGSESERRAVITQSSSWLNGNGVKHAFMDDLGDYIYARTKSTLTRATFDGTQLAYTFTGRAATADGGLVSTQLLMFQDDNEGSWQTVPGFLNGLQVNRGLAPAIDTISPATGPSTGGTTVTISGEGFTSGSSVFFGQSAAASVTFVNSSTLQAVTPASAQGTVGVRVVNANGTAALANSFTYTPPPRILVAAYSFDEGSGTTVNDLSGNGNHGTINGATWSTAGKYNRALSFNGNGNMVTVADSASLDLTTGMTLETWVNPSALGTAWRTAILKEQSAGLVYGMYANTNTTRPSGHVFVGTELDTRGTAALPLNTWSHLALTYDGTTLRLFVNAVEVSNRPISGSMLTSTGALRIGGNAVWSEYFSGLMDDVRIFNRASTVAEIQSDMNTALGDSTPPAVSISAPLNGATVSGTITVSANATDNLAVAGVQFLLDGAPMGAEDISAPYSISWNSATVGNGSHAWTARARDASANQTTSVPVNITVANAPDTTPPSVSMTAPADGATVSGTVTVSANANDNVAVAGVQFLLDGVPLGAEDTSAPYSISWNAAAASSGPHTLSARARDLANNLTTSAVVNVTNVPPDLTSPTVSVTAPANGTTVSGTVTVSADANDNVGVVGVQFLLDGVALGNEDTASPYSITWNSAASTNGLHNLTARARDAAGNQTTSAAVAVNVTGGLANGLVAAYGFNEGTGTTTTDFSGSNNTGTITGATWNAAGKFGQALSFNGTTNWVTVNDSASLDLTTGMTVEAWVNPAALGTTWRTVVMKEQTGGLAYGLYANTNTSRPSAHVFIGNEQDIRGPAALPVSVWSHLAMTYNGTTLRLYVNGTEVINQATSGSMLTSTAPLRIGGNSPWGEFFSGLIDEVRIYNRALSAAEIQNDMNLPVGVADTTPPTASMTAPANNATVSGLVTVSATAADNVGVSGVQFLLDGAPLGTEDTTSPYSLSWNSATVGNGPHTLAARARDAANNLGTSTVVNVTVANDVTPPTVAITNPAGGATVSDQITVSANASDNLAVAGVQFFVDGSPIGSEDTTTPYSVTWNTATVANGSHALTARARDAANNQTTSQPVTVTVSNAPEAVPPTVSMTAPADGATVSGTVTVSANASDNVGVVGVQFLLDGASLGSEDTTAPYSISWNAAAAAAGPHTLAARARDAAGNQTTSAVVNVTNVIPDTTAPSVSVTNPANGATVTGQVTVSADASDNVGVVGVQFLLDGVALGNEDTTAPYSITWNSAASTNGLHNLTARARDAANNQTTSNPTAVTVTGGLANGLVAAYGFNEGSGTTTADVSGTGNTGTITGATWNSAGKFGQALSFNGTTNWVTVNDSASLDLTTGMTVEAWVNPAALGTNWRTVVLKEQNGGLVYGLYANSNTSRPSAHIFVGTERDIRGTAILPLNTWSHLAMTYNGTTMRLFVNGTEVSNLAVAGSTLTSTGALRIGGNSVWGEFFSGLIDEVRIYNRALAATEIQNDMNTPLGTPPSDPTPPTVSMTAPADGATVSGTVTVSANANDNVSVRGVQFMLDGVALDTEDATAPYSISWNTGTVLNGSHTLTARARDAAGNQATSTAVVVTVNNSAPPPPAGGLVAAYGFNEGSGTTVSDGSGGGNNGTITAATWSTAGKFGQALSFNGTTAWVTVNDSASLDLTTGMTVEAWVNPAALGTAWRTAVMKEQTSGLAYGLYGNSNSTRPSGHVFITSEQDTRGTAALPLNTWSHLAMTFNGTTLRLFVNGTEVSNTTASGSLLTSTGALRIGGNSVWGEYFSGLIDEVRIYNRALSATEIQSDMNTPVSAGPPVDPTPPTVSVIAPAQNVTVSGLTTVYAEASDNIAVTGVQFLIDGSPLGPEVTSAPFTRTWNTVAVSNTTHTVTAIARDGSNNQTTSAPVTVTVSNVNDPAVVGQWSAPFAWPIVAVNLIVTRTGEVISWDGPPSNGGSSAQLWNPTSGQFTAIPNNVTDMFCDAAVVLADGRVLAIGGHASVGVGIPNADAFDPISKQWTPVTSMSRGRWYPTATVLSDGRVLVMTGSDTCYDCMVRIPEIYNPTTNQWTSLAAIPQALPAFYYPLMFLLPDGRLLEAGGTETSVPTVTRVLNLSTQAWTTVDPLSPEGHSPVMYELGKIMKSGVTPDVGVSTAPSLSTTYTLDMTQPTPRWQQTPNMAFPRAYHVQTLLPDGTVLATGGGLFRDGTDYGTNNSRSALAAELWAPATKTWSTMASAQNGRLYHSTAVLLLDGRVLISGSGRLGAPPQFNAEIFSPPYLFKGPRPTIPSTLANAAYGSTFFVSTSDAASITSVTLLRLSATTHSFNMEQRFLRLNFTQAAGGLNVQAPANSNMAPPGYYALYVLNGAGVPSRAAVIRIQ